MKRYIVIALLPVLVLGCDVAQDLREAGDKQAKVQKVMKERYGWESQVGWNIHNGVLRQVTVVLNAAEVREEKVSTLEAAVREAVSQSFNAKPEALFIQIASTVNP